MTEAQLLAKRASSLDRLVRWTEEIREKGGTKVVVRFLMLWLLFRNRFRKTTITARGGPVVSLTTHGRRIKRVYLAIESIAAGAARPSRVILWLDEPKVFGSLPPTLIRLQRRGLEIKLTDKYGPHCKYYPYLKTQTSHSIPLVTADDDIIYPWWWLQQLNHAYRKHPLDVNCYRARAVMLNEDGELVGYQRWPFCRTNEAKYSHLLTGVSGVIYPPALLDSVRRAGTEFLQVSPRADDLWLHAQVIRAGYKVRQMYTRPVHFPVVPGTEGSSLRASNVDEGRNDLQARATYTDSDIGRMQLDCERSGEVRSCSRASSREELGDLVTAWVLFTGLTE
jgi:hypothetical protein